MSLAGNDVKLCKESMHESHSLYPLFVLASFPVGEPGTNLTTVTFGHRSGKLLATGGEDNTIHIYLIGQMTSLLVRVNIYLPFA